MYFTDDHKKIEILSAAHKNVSNFKSGKCIFMKII